MKTMLLFVVMGTTGCALLNLSSSNQPADGEVEVVSQSGQTATLRVSLYGLMMDVPTDPQHKWEYRREAVTDTEFNIVLPADSVSRFNNQFQIGLLANSTYWTGNLEEFVTEQKAAKSLFHLAEGTELDDGFDAYFTYWDDHEKKMAYVSQRTIDSKQVTCQSWGISLGEMKQVRAACRSLRL